ncbi:hypothetical protein [Niveibacterium sp. SC-1]|uniref:hypothetical protein n=1 Tax=Niveibacterium sp. SC-1 TaxID=3135646 RepID=UPI00311ED5FF
MTSPTTTDPRTPALAGGDVLLRRSQRFMRYGLLLILPLAALGVFILPTWKFIASLSGIAFAASATLFGLALAVLPVAVLVLVGTALFLRVESLVRPRSRSLGLPDRLALIGALLLSIVPALWPLSMAARAVFGDGITIRQPIEHHFTMFSDPLAFWENVGYWLIAAVALAALAGYYWRSRWQAYRRSRQS